MPFLISLSILCLIISILLGLAAYLVHQRQTEALKFPETTGTILVSKYELTNKYSTPTEGTLGTYWEWIPEVQYEYQVNGEKITGSKISNATYTERAQYSYADKKYKPPSTKLMSILNKYPVDKQVTVYYDLANPKDALLEINTSGPVVIGTVAILCLLASLVSLLVYFLQKNHFLN